MNAATPWEILTETALPSIETSVLVNVRADIAAELNRRLPRRRGAMRRLNIVLDRERTFEINLPDLESSSLLSAIDALALELRQRGEMIGPLVNEFAGAADTALAASMRDLSDDQIAMLVEQAAAIERVAGVAFEVQIERSTRVGVGT